MLAATEEKNTRIAIVSNDRCKPKKCHQECKRSCPVNRTGKHCIEVTPTDKICFISEILCIGCGICTKKCPLEAITIINIPGNLEKDTIHRFSANSFKLHRLPTLRPGDVLGLVGTNGIGKSTALKILAGKLKPNLGRYSNPPDWRDILDYFRGCELQNYFKKLLEDDLKIVMKPQYIDSVAKFVSQAAVKDLLNKKDTKNNQEEICETLDLSHLVSRTCGELSGGELQRLCIAISAVQKADVYFFDEPSSYLDVKQRLKAASVVRGLLTEINYVVVVEHDLSVLDYLSDFICCLYGMAGVYGVVTMRSSVREGINNFLDGFIPTENLRFRETALVFKVAETASEEEIKRSTRNYYPDMIKKLGSFELSIESGHFSDSEIIVMLGENGTGKTTFIRMLAGRLESDNENNCPEFTVSYKPQKINAKSDKLVQQLLFDKIKDAALHPQFQTDVIKPLDLEKLYDQEVKNLSGGELQRVALTICLGTPADVYLIDEPSAHLDSEQRLHAARVIKRYILHAKKTAFVVEHDFIMATYLADRVIVFDGEPGVRTTACSPEALLTGMNKFLKSMDITFRRDRNNYRPRINKPNSLKDNEQKKSGNFFYLET